MAKRAKQTESPAEVAKQDSESAVARAEPLRDDASTQAAPASEILGDFAEDLGKLLGTAEAKASSWLDQRKSIASQLAQIRDTASHYLDSSLVPALLPVPPLGLGVGVGVVLPVPEPASRRSRHPLRPPPYAPERRRAACRKRVVLA